VTNRVIDPRTGEILGARIVLSELSAGHDKSEARAFLNGLPEMAAPYGESADFAPTLLAQNLLLHTVLAAQGTLALRDPLPLRLIGQQLRHTTLHEVGHSLGLAHNYRASMATPLDKLGDLSWLREHGVSCSVMDYVALNLPNGPVPDDFLFYSPQIGDCDRIAIKFGYGDDAAQAQEVARQAARQNYLYAPEHGHLKGSELDPSIAPWDLSDDPLGWAKARAALMKTLWQRAPERLLSENARFEELTEIMLQLIAEYEKAILVAVKYIGGERQYLDHYGDPGGHPPNIPIPKEKQLQALALLHSHAFADEALALPRQTLNQLGSAWWSRPSPERSGVAITEKVAFFQAKILERLFQPFLFERLRDAELRFGSTGTITMPELFSNLTQGIFSELWNGPGRDVSVQRRALQRLLIEKLEVLL
jgi:hypothetical protein